MADRRTKNAKSRREFSSPAGASVSYQHSSGGVEEILRPTLVVSGGRSYRKLTDVEFGRRPGDTERDRERARRRETGRAWRREEERGKERREEIPQPPQSPPSAYTDDAYDEGEDTEAHLEGIQKLPNGGYRLKLPIPPVFFKYIIGKEGRTKKGIERDTECHLWLPSKGKEGDVVIEGYSQSSVADAKRRVEIIVWTNRDKERPTHFISIPLIQPQIKERVKEFITTSLDLCRHEKGIVSEVFQVPEKFHLTLGVLRIFSQEEEEKAKEVVKEAVRSAIPLLGGDPAVMCVEGVECMNDDPSSVDVLYAKVFLTDHSDRLQNFVDSVVGYVIENAPDLMRKEFERDGVKLHATLMNSKFPVGAAKDAAERERKNWRRREGSQREIPAKQPFNATKIFKEFGEFHFGQLLMDTLHLSRRKEYGMDGFYRCVQDYHLPDLQPD